MTFPIIFSNDPAVALRSIAVRERKAVGMTRLACEPWANTARSAYDCIDHWLQFRTLPLAVSLGFVGVQGFDVDRRDSNGVLIGCTQADYDAGVAAGIMPHARDAQRVKYAAAIWQGDGVPPDVVHVDIEPQTPKPANVSQEQFDRLRIATVSSILNFANLRPSSVVIEFTAIGRAKSYAVNGDGVRVPVLPVSTRYKGSQEFYSVRQDGTNNPFVATKLAAFLGGVNSGACPWIDTLDRDFTDAALDLCDQFGATPMVWCDDGLGGKGISAETQCEWMAQALDRRSNG